MDRCEPEKRDEMDYMLLLPIPGHGSSSPVQTAQQIADDTAAFLAAGGM